MTAVFSAHELQMISSESRSALFENRLYIIVVSFIRSNRPGSLVSVWTCRDASRVGLALVTTVSLRHSCPDHNELMCIQRLKFPIHSSWGFRCCAVPTGRDDIRTLNICSKFEATYTSVRCLTAKKSTKLVSWCSAQECSGVLITWAPGMN